LYPLLFDHTFENHIYMTEVGAQWFTELIHFISDLYKVFKD